MRSFHFRWKFIANLTLIDRIGVSCRIKPLIWWNLKCDLKLFPWNCVFSISQKGYKMIIFYWIHIHLIDNFEIVNCVTTWNKMGSYKKYFVFMVAAMVCQKVFSFPLFEENFYSLQHSKCVDNQSHKNNLCNYLKKAMISCYKDVREYDSRDHWHYIQNCCATCNEIHKILHESKMTTVMTTDMTQRSGAAS